MTARPTTDTRWTLTLPQTAPMSLNHRGHWAAKARQTREFRDATHLLCKAWKVGTHDRIRFQLLFQPGTNRTRDADNLSVTSKACLDGARDAGVIADDSPEYVDHLMPALLPVVKGEPRLFVVIEALS